MTTLAPPALPPTDAPTCDVCGRTAHAGQALERVAAGFLNNGFAVLMFLTPAPRELPEG